MPGSEAEAKAMCVCVTEVFTRISTYPGVPEL